MRLARHEELVERMAVAVCLTHKRASPDDVAKAALDALLAAVVEMGVGKEAAGCGDVVWCAHPKSYGLDENGKPDGRHFPALILRLEGNSHDE